MPTINPELQSLIPPLSADEYRQLEANILSDGCHDALVVWQETQTLLDGHHRHEICERHGLPYNITEISLPDLESAKAWMIANQLGRRNLTPEQMSYFRGAQYNLLKKTSRGGGDRKSSEARHQKAQSDTFDDTATQLAAQHKVSKATIKRDAAYQQSIDAIADAVGPEARQDLIGRKARVTKREAKQLAARVEANPEAVKEVLTAMKEAPTPQAARAIVVEATKEAVSHQNGAQPSIPATVPPPDTPPAEVDLETLLRTTAACLDAIHDGLLHRSFGETFDQYNPLWDAVYAGCGYLLMLVDGETETQALTTSVEEPAAPVATTMIPEPAMARRRNTTQMVREAALHHGWCTCAVIAEETGLAVNAVWQVLERLSKTGQVERRGESRNYEYRVRREEVSA